MADSEFVTVRGETLEGKITWVGAQEFIIVAVPSGQDASIAEIHTRQEREIVPGMRIKYKKTGEEFRILSNPVGIVKLVHVQDVHRREISTHFTEQEIRQNFQFVG